MKTRLGTKGALEREQLERGMHAHRNETRKWLQHARHIDVMEVECPTLVREPRSIIPRLVDFLGKDRLVNFDKMADVVDPALYRRKKSER